MARQLIRAFVTGALALVLVSLAVPAFAQNGALRGRVVNEDGQPVNMVEIILDFVGDIKRQVKTITDKNGEWVRVGLPVGGGTWTITAKKDKLLGTLDKVTIKMNETQKLQDIVLLSEESRAAGVKRVSMSAEAAAAAAKKQAETDKLLAEANAAITGGQLDDAIVKLTALTERVENCAVCFAKIGDVQVQRKDLAAAEAAYLKSIAIDGAVAGPYNSLAAIYNEQRKFEEATKMSAKASELMGASGAADPAAIFNQGVILWNQTKVAEAKEKWVKVIELDPKMSDAHYWFGMASLNQGNMADAKKGFQEYLKLAPTGQHAEAAKAILAQIK